VVADLQEFLDADAGQAQYFHSSPGPERQVLFHGQIASFPCGRIIRPDLPAGGARGHRPGQGLPLGCEGLARVSLAGGVGTAMITSQAMPRPCPRRYQPVAACRNYPDHRQLGLCRPPGTPLASAGTPCLVETDALHLSASARSGGPLLIASGVFIGSRPPAWTLSVG